MLSKSTNTLNLITYGFEPCYVEKYLDPIVDKDIFNVTHVFIGEGENYEDYCANNNTYHLTNTKDVNNYSVDYSLLSELEQVSNRSINSVIESDRCLMYKDYSYSLSYVSFIATNFIKLNNQYKPNIVMGNFDNAFSLIVNMCCKYLGIKWISPFFYPLPSSRVGYCSDLSPDTLIPYSREDDLSKLYSEAEKNYSNFINKRLRSHGYEILINRYKVFKNIFSLCTGLRKRLKKEVYYNPYVWPTIDERFSDIIKRFKNRIITPKRNLVSRYPESPYIYFPLHMSPESCLDTWASTYKDQVALIAQVIHQIPIDYKLIIKPHFMDPYTWTRANIRKITSYPNVYFTSHLLDSYKLIKNASLILTVQGSSALEASLLGKPSITFGKSPYNIFSSCACMKNINTLREEINSMINNNSISKEKIIMEYSQFLSNSSEVYESSFDWERPLTSNETNLMRDQLVSVVEFCLSEEL